jgi:hypothetical protein
MSTQAQVDANRRNAQHSTGPKTDAGKAASSQNAHQHGLCSPAAVAPGEDPAAYQAFATALVAELDPIGMDQRVQAERIAFLSWKLQRIPAIEASTLEGTRLCFKREALKQGKIRSQFPTADLIAGDLDRMMKLQTYEMRLSRALEQARKELRRLKDDAARTQEQSREQVPPASAVPTPTVAPVAHLKPQSDQQLQENWVRSAGSVAGSAPTERKSPQEVAA